MFEKGLVSNSNLKGQATIFIIVGVVIVAGVLAYFIFSGDLFGTNIPASLEPAYANFQDCLKNDLTVGIDILGSQGGYIYTPEFEAGSRYSPFSSQLDFMGNGIPYWYYISGNGVEKRQVPTMSDMESDLGKFVESRIRDCNFKSLYEQGFIIDMKEPNADVSISNSKVQVNLDMDFVITKGDESVSVSNHKIDVNSKLGAMYQNAQDIYEAEQKDLFLEERTIDTLRLYAPVDGVEVQCAPKTWIADDVFENLDEGLTANTLALKVKGGDYSLAKSENKYFVLDDVKSDFNVLFLTSKDWPHNYEVNPTNGNVLISEPVGNQEGLGALGFCYVPYHYVYDVKYPVLVQIYDDASGEIFQFPLAVVIDDNNPRKPLADAEAADFGLPALCEYKNTALDVSVYDTNLRKVDANVSFECFGTQCDIGQTKNGGLNGKFPQCVNGKVIAQAQGYEDGEYEVSSVNPSSVEIILDKLYSKDIELRVDGRVYSGEAIISFSKADKGTKTIVYPEQKSIDLSEGQYEISVTIYDKSDLTLGASTKQECIEIPASGIGGLFGITKENCFTVDIPEQSLTNLLSGGGKQDYYISQSELEGNGNIVIDSEGLPPVRNLDQLQENYLLYENSGLEVNFNA